MQQKIFIEFRIRSEREVVSVNCNYEEGWTYLKQFS